MNLFGVFAAAPRRRVGHPPHLRTSDPAPTPRRKMKIESAARWFDLFHSHPSPSGTVAKQARHQRRIDSRLIPINGRRWRLERKSDKAERDIRQTNLAPVMPRKRQSIEVLDRFDYKWGPHGHQLRPSGSIGSLLGCRLIDVSRCPGTDHGHSSGLRTEDNPRVRRRNEYSLRSRFRFRRRDDRTGLARLHGLTRKVLGIPDTRRFHVGIGDFFRDLPVSIASHSGKPLAHLRDPSLLSDVTPCPSPAIQLNIPHPVVSLSRRLR